MKQDWTWEKNENNLRDYTADRSFVGDHAQSYIANDNDIPPQTLFATMYSSTTPNESTASPSGVRLPKQ